MRSMTTSVLLIHGRDDSICPPVMAEKLYDRAADPKQVHWVEGADHNNGLVVGGSAYRETLRRAIEDWTG